MKKKKIVSCVLYCLICLSLGFYPSALADPSEQVAAASEQPSLPELPQNDLRISMDFRDADLKDVLKIFSQQSGLNFIPSEDVQDKKITLYLENVPVKNAINSIVQANGLTYETGPAADIFIVRPSGEAKIKTITKIYTLNFAQVAPLTVQATSSSSLGSVSSASSAVSSSTSASSTSAVTQGQGIVDILGRLLSSAGKIIPDQRTNSLIITDIPEQFPLIEDMIIKLDTPTPQIFIEAEIVETTTEVTDKLGLEYGGTSGEWSGTYSGLEKGYSFPYNTRSFKNHGASPTFAFGTLTFSDLTMTLKALSSQADTKYLARPKLLTLNNETAVIDITAETYVGSVTTSQPQTETSTTSAERMTTGLSLKVTPQVNAAEYITMILEPSIARTEASAVNTGFLNPIKRSAKAKVMVKDGETVFIGGLLDTQKTDTKRKVPFLGDVPLLGGLFKSNSEADKQTEILIFITPHIVAVKTTEETKPEAAVTSGAIEVMAESSQAVPLETAEQEAATQTREGMIQKALEKLEKGE